jgi:peptide/nickel transport system permease protein
VASYPSGPSAEHLLGTDRLGRDYLSRLVYGARIALVVGVLAGVLATTLGFVVAVVAAYARSPRVPLPLPGGRATGVAMPVESVLMRTTDVFLSLPALLLAMAFAAVLHPSVALAGFVITAVLWTGPARIIYGGARAVRDAEFVVAARALGASPARLLLRHVAPQVAPLAIAYGAVTIGIAILFEASLSYLGAGVPPPTASWGNMVADHALYYATDPRLVILPGLAILLAVLAFTLLGDALRDAFDPRTRR